MVSELLNLMAGIDGSDGFSATASLFVDTVTPIWLQRIFFGASCRVHLAAAYLL